MKPWHAAIANDFYLTNPEIGRINVWAKTKSGKKSRSVSGWDIYAALKKVPECRPLFSDKHVNIGVYRDHLEIY